MGEVAALAGSSRQALAVRALRGCVRTVARSAEGLRPALGLDAIAPRLALATDGLRDLLARGRGR